MNQFQKSQSAKILASYINQDPLEKGGKRAFIGEVRKYGKDDWVKHHDGWVLVNHSTGKHLLELPGGKRVPAEDHHIEHAKKHLGTEKKEDSKEEVLTPIEKEKDRHSINTSKIQNIKEGIERVVKDYKGGDTDDKVREHLAMHKIDKYIVDLYHNNFQEGDSFKEIYDKLGPAIYKQLGIKHPQYNPKISPEIHKELETLIGNMDANVSKHGKIRPEALADAMNDLDSPNPDYEAITQLAENYLLNDRVVPGGEDRTLDSKIGYEVIEKVKEQLEGKKEPQLVPTPTPEPEPTKEESKPTIQSKQFVQDKDWERMIDLHLAGKDGKPSVITDKKKAIARFVAGLKITGEKPSFSYGDWDNIYGNFGNRAKELGATKEEIQKVFDETELPAKFTEKIEQKSSKKLDNRFVGSLVKKILDAGHDITFEKTNGNALTHVGMYAMERNGRKWTIGYKAEVTLANGKKAKLAFDAITDEAIDYTPTTYVLAHGSDPIFDGASRFSAEGINKFSEAIMSGLNKNK